MPCSPRDVKQAASRHDRHHASASAGLIGDAGAQGVVRVGSRRWFLQVGAAGLAGASATSLVSPRGLAAATTSSPQSAGGDRKAVILFWLSGGPSHIDMWDPKPAAPREIRGPYQSIATAVPGVRASICRCRRRSWTSSP
ncbi:MAG: DUF1501 domain-containing protein [Pirellulales bacterium]